MEKLRFIDLGGTIINLYNIVWIRDADNEMYILFLDGTKLWLESDELEFVKNSIKDSLKCYPGTTIEK